MAGTAHLAPEILKKVHQRSFDMKGGVKLKLVYASSGDLQEKFNYFNVPGNIEAHLANFGEAQIGSSVTAPVYLPSTSSNGCKKMEDAEWKYAADNQLSYNGFVIVEPGGCSFERKARHIEKLGGQVAMIIDNPQPEYEEDETKDEEHPEEGDKENHDGTNWILFDSMYDGTGSSLHIPTIIIPYTYGMELLTVFAEETSPKIVLKADFETSQQEKGRRLRYELFYGSILDLPSDLILDIYKYQHAMHRVAKFKPRIKTFDCQFCPEEFIEQQCIEKGEYCFFVPNEEEIAKYPALETKQMLHENLRQRCLYEIADEYDDEDRHIFLNYLYDVRVGCLENKGLIDHHCSRHVMERLGVNYQSVKDCMKYEKKGIHHKTDAVDWFEMDREKQVEYGITLTPAVVINKHLYQGELKGEAIFRQICQSFPPGKSPELCSEGYDLEPELGKLSDFVKPPEGHMPLTVIFIILIVFIINLLAVIFVTRRAKRKEAEKKMQNEVQMHVDKYFKLQNNERNEI